jgi:regulator of sigma E protease
VLHEWGHYITARWFKCRVEKFYLFFNPWFSLFKKKVGDTEYGLGWLPLGGYVKISGMIDESMDKEQLKQPAQPHEFRSKKAWQRLIIMLGGIIVNILLAFVIYAMVLFVWGEQKVPIASIKNGLAMTDSIMYRFGFKDGDLITHVDGKEVVYYEDLLTKLIVGEKVTVTRNGAPVEVILPVNLIGQLAEMKKAKRSLFTMNPSVLIYDLEDTSVAYKSGLRVKDQIIGVGETQINTYADYKNRAWADIGKTDAFTVLRGKDTVRLNITIPQDGIIGLQLGNQSPELMDSLGYCKVNTQNYTLLQSIPGGVRMTYETLKNYLAQLGKVFQPKTGGYKALGGFKAVASIMPTRWGAWEAFFRITAFLSIMLAFLNLLPIPALDGGHALFTLIEMITGRKPNEKFLEYAQIVGMILLLALMLFANGNDWFGWGKGK